MKKKLYKTPQTICKLADMKSYLQTESLREYDLTTDGEPETNEDFEDQGAKREDEDYGYNPWDF